MRWASRMARHAGECGWQPSLWSLTRFSRCQRHDAALSAHHPRPNGGDEKKPVRNRAAMPFARTVDKRVADLIGPRPGSGGGGVRLKNKVLFDRSAHRGQCYSGTLLDLAINQHEAHRASARRGRSRSRGDHG